MSRPLPRPADTVALRCLLSSHLNWRPHPSARDGDTLTLEFPQSASFHLKLAEDPKSAALLRTDLILAAIAMLCVLGLACYGALHAGEIALHRWRGE